MLYPWKVLLAFFLSHCISSCSYPFRSLHLFPLYTSNLTCTLFIIGWSLTASSHLLFYFIVHTLHAYFHFTLSLWHPPTQHLAFSYLFFHFTGTEQGQGYSDKGRKGLCTVVTMTNTRADAHTESAQMRVVCQFGSDGGCSGVCVGLWRVVLPEGKSSGLCLLAFRFTSPCVSLTRPPQAAFTSSRTYHSEEQK